ncbi:unnamed protein product [Rhizophagus irregularis]|nr:unnamed protein product [Rhizophagus irregularis]
MFVMWLLLIVLLLLLKKTCFFFEKNGFDYAYLNYLNRNLPKTVQKLRQVLKGRRRKISNVIVKGAKSDKQCHCKEIIFGILCYLDQIPLHAEYSHMREDWKMDSINLSNNRYG